MRKKPGKQSNCHRLENRVVAKPGSARLFSPELAKFLGYSCMVVVKDFGIFSKRTIVVYHLFAEFLLVVQSAQTSSPGAQIEKMYPRSHEVGAWNEALLTPGAPRHHHRKLELQTSAHNSQQ